MILIKKTLFYFVLFAFFYPLSVYAEWEAIVVNVFDGDTLIVSRDGYAEIIRLYGIDCPEKKQPYGLKAKDFTMDLVSREKIQVIPIGHRRYLNYKVYIGDQCLNEELLSAGYAWYCHDSAEEKWAEIEKNARSSKRGLWSKKNPMPPWEFKGNNQRDNGIQIDQSIHTIKWGTKHRGTVQEPRLIKRKRYRRR